MPVTISVILPVYNGMGYLEKSVQSVLEQNYPDYEFLICDDCSTDNSYEYLKGLSHPSLKIFRNEQNKGLFPTLNFLVSQSAGKLIKLWSQDDIMLPGCLQTTAEFHQKYPQIGFSYSSVELMDENDHEIPSTLTDHTPELISSELHARIAFYTGSIAGNIANVTIDRAALEETGKFNEQMKIAGDFDMWVRLAKNRPVGRIIKKLIRLRCHKGQFSRAEKYFLYHLIEDTEVYKTLFSYTKEDIKRDGIKMLRWNKYVFYFTLMLKAFLKGDLSTGWAFMSHLSKVDNVLFLFFRWLLVKTGLRKQPSIMDNNFLFTDNILQA